MDQSDIVTATLGGAIIGVASVILFWFNGRIAGISGILGGYLYQVHSAERLITRSEYPIVLTVAAGLLVGFGTRQGSGCTSGHGVCGISRLSLRSIVATVVFVLLGMASATFLHHLRA